MQQFINTYKYKYKKSNPYSPKLPTSQPPSMLNKQSYILISTVNQEAYKITNTNTKTKANTNTNNLKLKVSVFDFQFLKELPMDITNPKSKFAKRCLLL